jgi:hypothetical protein
MSVEEVFHLRKDTLVYIIFNPESVNSQLQKIKTENSFKRFGYESIRHQPYADLQKHPGYRLEFSGEFKIDPALSIEKSKWYAVTNIFRKIRKETRPAIITFAGNELLNDISNEIEKKNFEILGFNLNQNNVRRSQPTAGMYITPLEARVLFKQKLVNEPIFTNIDNFMIKYYNETIDNSEQKYQNFSMTTL